ncbi:unnamed protein product, partial [marine sediment metagenome]
SRFKAGVGLAELGFGIKELAQAPLGGLGLGLGEFGTGLRTFAESLGDIGRGFGELFANIPPLFPSAGGSDTDLDAGGGGNVPSNGNGTGGYTPGQLMNIGGVPHMWDDINGWGWRSLGWAA